MRKLFFLLLGVVFFTGQLWAQRTVSGKVTDDKNNPVANASVVVKGTTTGTVTKTDGSYSLTVPANAKALIFSSVNMTTIEVPLGKEAVVNATLTAEEKTMSEVVMVGYGTQRKKEVSGNVATVKGSAFVDKPVQSFEQALAGRATGVQITVPNGVLNTPPVFRIRGTNSISLSSYPLIVIDGVPTPVGDFSSTAAAGNALASINPYDIESIDIAKDAAATAIYGSRAANGVVFITTKKGKSGKAKISYNGSVGFTKVYGLPKLLNAQQFTDFKNQAAANNPGVNSTNPLGATYVNFATATDANGKLIDTRWYDFVYRNGFSYDNNVNVSGGSENTNYYFSAGYTHQEGILKRNDFDRKNLLFNLETRPNKVITYGGKMSYSNEKNLAATASGSLNGEAFSITGLGREVLVLYPNVSPYKNDGSYNIDNPTNNGVGKMNNSVLHTYYNPVVALDKNRSNSETNHIQANIYFQVKPVKYVTLRTVYGIDYLLVDNEVFLTPIHGDGYASNGSASSTEGKYKTWGWTNTAQFDNTFAGKHTVTALIGNEQTRRTTIGFGENRTQISDPVYTVIQAGWTINNTSGNAYGENYFLSSFARINYDFNKKYFLNVSGRRDEYSAFAQKKANFWGAGVKWDVAKESFWQGSSIDRIVSSFMLRGSYGKVGNTAGVGDYASFSTYGSGLYGGLPTLIFSQAGNPNLHWETSKKTDAGFSFGLFKDRITGDFAYYYNNISDLILNVPQSPSAGLPTTVPANVGTMYNKGVEISITANPIKSKDFNWTSTFNLTTNKNRVTSLAPGLTEVLASTSGSETVSRTAVGYSLGTLWLMVNGGVDPATGRRILLNKNGDKVLYSFYQNTTAGIYNWINPDGTRYSEPGQPAGVGVTQAKDGIMAGNTNPRQYGGWDNTFRYRDFELNVLLTYQLGFYVYYGTNAGLHDQRFWNNAIDVLHAWSKPGDITDIPKPLYNDNNSNGSGFPITYNMFKGDFVKLKTVTLAYNIPSKILNKVKISNARVYVSGQNLHIFTNYPGPDPEVSSNGNGTINQGIDRNTIANGRVISFGVNVSF